MDYRKEIMGLTAKLAEKYTKKESSSVSYETARMLTGAVLYCLKEYSRENGMEGNMLLNFGGECGEDLEACYQKGYELVLYKVRKAKLLYHRLLQGFEDYGCFCLRDTVLKGMPEFFRRYDARFCPQDHILTLDYPVLGEEEGLCGADRIWDYLCCIRMEKDFLKLFRREYVEQVLFRIHPEYQELFLGNIVREVLEDRYAAIIGRESVEENAGKLLERLCGGRQDLKEYLLPTAVQIAHSFNLRKKECPEYRDRSGWR